MFFFSYLAIISITMHLLVYNNRFKFCTILNRIHCCYTNWAHCSNRNSGKCLLPRRRMKTPCSLATVLERDSLDEDFYEVLHSCSRSCIYQSTRRAASCRHVLCSCSRWNSQSSVIQPEFLHRPFCTLPNHIPL